MTIRSFALILWLSFVGSAFAAEQMTVQDIVRLSQAGLKDATIISQIIASGSKFELKTADILYLKENAVSEELINFLINTPTLDQWRELEDQAAKSDAASLEDYVEQQAATAEPTAEPDVRRETIYRYVYLEPDFWFGFHPYGFWNDVFPIGFYYYCGRYYYYFGCYNWHYNACYPDGYYSDYRYRYKPPRRDRSDRPERSVTGPRSGEPRYNDSRPDRPTKSQTVQSSRPQTAAGHNGSRPIKTAVAAPHPTKDEPRTYTPSRPVKDEPRTYTPSRPVSAPPPTVSSGGRPTKSPTTTPAPVSPSGGSDGRARK